MFASKSNLGLMVGLKNGQVFSIFLDNSLAILITEVQSSVRCLDLNSTRTKVAIVDDAGRLVVRDLENDCILFQDSGVNSVAWNNTLESMLCYSHTNGGLSIRVGTLPQSLPPQQSFVGVVVGLSGYTAFCLKGNVMNTVALALSATLWQFIESNLFENAYEVACLGVTENDWEALAFGALEALNLKIAKMAFIKTRNLAWLEFIEEIELVQKYNDLSHDVINADILAFQGKFKEAARLYKKSGFKNKAVTLFTDLKMFDLAKDFLKDDTDIEDSKELIRKRAEWACSVHEQRTAVELLMSAGDVDRAIEIVAQEKWPDMLIAIGRKLDETQQRESLELIGQHLKRLKALPLAAEIYKKLGMEAQVVQLHIEARDWNQAFKLAENYPEMMKSVHMEHAKWLSESDQFFEAYESFMKAGCPSDAFALLQNLTDNALKEDRFSDAGYFTWIKARQILKELENNEGFSEKHVDICDKFKAIASIYYAYAIIHSYIREPFTSSPPLTLFNTARFIVNQIGNEPPPKGISLFALYYTLSKQAKILGSMKLHLMINNKLQNLKAPAGIQEQVDMSIINSRASLGGFSDPEELLQMCYKCSNFNMHMSGNKCSNCYQKFIFSYVSFEILPLVEFYPAKDISSEEAERLLMAPPKRELEIDINSHDFDQNNLNEFLPMILSRDELRSLDPRNVLLVKRQKPFITQFFKNLMPEIHIIICSECQNAFHAEDFENQVLQKKYCPFCRVETTF
jgi:intraflagellar transport protein 122